MVAVAPRGSRASAEYEGPDGLVRVRTGVALTDFVVIVWAVFGALIVRFGLDAGSDIAASGDRFSLGYPAFSLALAVTWWLSLRLHGAYEVQTLGRGATEYRLLMTATLRLFATVALLAYALKIEVARGYVLLALPAGLLGLFIARRMWRRWLGARRRTGEFNHDVLVVGEAAHARGLIEAFTGAPETGYGVVGVCTSTTDDECVGGVPVVGTEHQAAQVAMELGVDIIACGAVHRLGPAGLRRLGWALEGSGIELLVSPGLTEIAGPRVVARPVAGLPLLHIEAPTFSGAPLIMKSVLDWLAALVLLIVFSPVMLVVAAVIKFHDGGPVLFRQERIGLDGEPFQMTKFRSMGVGAEAELEELKRQQTHLLASTPDDNASHHAFGPAPTSEGATGGQVDRGVLFKMEDDPRVTPFGRFIRRYSIDELPQLFDVLLGRMSLVGPRPPLPAEVSQYEYDVHRRLLVKPGMTGLWQVNGRSNLSWDESVRLDLYYVENWSVALDMIILWRTYAAVVGRDGAY
ncbi:sugar transferase [Janibacter cremeus]|uniref:Exopolysaccharide biosynthesis polyprenyl glycosylphosphotransferase n=1 Tax=Janibacter cremeus TaxID=1285192 RepID=A0A852VSZ7_9MICO|nr:sugar transferase [Janibacter cremeus]NYF99038.1 exopolysaccharide biosynthesis polyprenyl glycosylphosphotransferase [Janibacter cremeus]